MENRLDKAPTVSRPEDDSLEAYKAWIAGKQLAQENTKIKFTQAEWLAGWKEYWREGSNYYWGS